MKPITESLFENNNNAGGKIYTNCSYAPPEVFAAAGYSLIRSWPGDVSQNFPDLLPTDFCPYSKAFLADNLSEESFKIVTTSCDAMRRIKDILGPEALLLEVPRVKKNSRVDFYYKQLRKIIEKLGIDPESNIYRSNLVTEIKKI